MAELRFAVVGDSGMWGQGLLTLDKYWFLAIGDIRKSLDRTLVFRTHLIKPRSGAKIRAKTGDRRSVALPTGRIVQTIESDRADFIDTYPELFASDEEAVAFLDPTHPTGEEPAARLFGDIPSTFPTITYQLNSIPDSEAARLDVLFLNGGANDLDFEAFLNPQANEDDFRSTYDVVFKTIFHDRLKTLLLTARRKCPCAAIFVVGYYSAIASTFGLDRLEAFFEYQAHASDFEVWLNGFFVFVDVQDYLFKAVARSNYGQALALFWMRTTVSELNDDPQTSRPALIFVPSGFTTANGLFSKEPLLHEEYEVKNVDDAVEQQRVQSYPRSDEIGRIRELRLALDMAEEASNQAELEGALEEIRHSVRELSARLKGPRALIDAMDEFDRRQMREAVTSELKRFNRVEIASFIHPNKAGAKRYAGNIVERFERNRAVSVRESIRELAANLSGNNRPEDAGVRGVLRRYGLEPALGLRACLQHVIVDSLAVEIVTDRKSGTKAFQAELSIDPEREKWLLTYLSNVDKVFQPGTTDLVPIDTFGELRLSDIKQVRISMVGRPFSDERAQWTIASLALYVNGKNVFRGSLNDRLTPGSEVTLAYPAH